jgi:hypothetical protein
VRHPICFEDIILKTYPCLKIRRSLSTCVSVLTDADRAGCFDDRSPSEFCYFLMSDGRVALMIISHVVYSIFSVPYLVP